MLYTKALVSVAPSLIGYPHTSDPVASRNTYITPVTLDKSVPNSPCFDYFVSPHRPWQLPFPDV
jgi:hypothetical protein